MSAPTCGCYYARWECGTDRAVRGIVDDMERDDARQNAGPCDCPCHDDEEDSDE